MPGAGEDAPSRHHRCSSGCCRSLSSAVAALDVVVVAAAPSVVVILVVQAALGFLLEREIDGRRTPRVAQRLLVVLFCVFPLVFLLIVFLSLCFVVVAVVVFLSIGPVLVGVCPAAPSAVAAFGRRAGAGLVKVAAKAKKEKKVD